MLSGLDRFLHPLLSIVSGCEVSMRNETVFGVTNSRCYADPSSDRVFLRYLVYFFLRDSMTPSAMHSHLPLRCIQVSTQT